MKFASAIKIIAGTIGTIILGAIGSGIWERILSPVLNSTGNFVTSLVSSISKTYSDSIYSRASSIASYDKSGLLGTLILIILSSGLFLYALNSITSKYTSPNIYARPFSPFLGWPGLVHSGAFLIIVLFLMSTDVTVAEIKKYSVTNMEIIRPYAGEKQYLTLRSNYLRIKNKEDFESFLEQLYIAASKANIDITKFENR